MRIYIHVFIFIVFLRVRLRVRVRCLLIVFVAFQAQSQKARQQRDSSSMSPPLHTRPGEERESNGSGTLRNVREEGSMGEGGGGWSIGKGRKAEGGGRMG